MSKTVKSWVRKLIRRRTRKSGIDNKLWSPRHAAWIWLFQDARRKG